MVGIAKFLGLKTKEGAQQTGREKAQSWKEAGREWLIANAGVSTDWQATDQIDIGTLGTILSRLQK
ncbi:hypothetical protein D3C77_588140 [compost metagenome]